MKSASDVERSAIAAVKAKKGAYGVPACATLLNNPPKPGKKWKLPARKFSFVVPRSVVSVTRVGDFDWRAYNAAHRGTWRTTNVNQSVLELANVSAAAAIELVTGAVQTHALLPRGEYARGKHAWSEKYLEASIDWKRTGKKSFRTIDTWERIQFVRGYLSYPFSTTAEVVIPTLQWRQSGRRCMPVGWLLWCCAQAYKQIYERHDEFGIWGHDIGDLAFEVVYNKGDEFAVAVGS